MEKENEAIKLFQYKYEDSVIAARVQLPEEEIKRLRKVWEAWN